MLIRKNLKATLLTLAMFASPIVARAQVGGINNPMGQNVIMTPGSYEQYQKTPVFNNVITTLQKRNDQAAALYQDSVRSFFTAFTDLQNYASDKLMKPAIASLTDSAKEMELKDYAANVQGYIELKRSVDLKISSIEMFPQSLAARIDVDAPGSGVNSIATITAGVNFSSVAKEFHAKLAEVDNQLRNQQIMVRTKNSGVQATKLLDMSLVKVEFNKTDFDAWSSEIKKARRLSDADRGTLTVYTRKLMEQVMVVLSTYGKGERWRQNMHDKEYEDRKARVIRDIADAFWQRAYFRMRYGMNLGMIGIKYDTKVFGLDRFMSNLNKITFQPVGTDSSYFAAREKEIAELVKTAGSKGQSLSKILHGEVGFVQSTNSIVAAVMGQDETAKALVPIVSLILNDLYEENLALTGKRNDLIARYKARYYDNSKPNSVNPNGYSDREVTLMRELELDFNATRMDDMLKRGLIPSVVSRTNNADEESLFGRAQDALRIGKIKAVDYAKAESIQRTIDAYLDSIADKSGSSDVDKLLGL